MTPKTVFIGLALVLAGVLLGMNVPTVAAQRDGQYRLSATGLVVWRMDHRTGRVSFCLSNREAETPRCSPWGPVGQR